MSEQKVEHKTKSVIIGRKRGEDPEFYTCFINLFDMNDAHLTDAVPTEFLEYDKILKVKIKDLVVNYYLDGNDLIINDLVSISVELRDGKLYVSGEQKWD